MAHDGAVSGRRSRRRSSAFSIDDITGEAFGPASCHLVPSGEEVAHALIDVLVDTTECRSTRPLAEVVRPAKQRPAQHVANFGPRIVVARHQQIADLGLELLHAFLGRARAQIPKTVRFVTVRSERVSRGSRAFLPSILQRGLGLVDGEPEPRLARVIGVGIETVDCWNNPQSNQSRRNAFRRRSAQRCKDHPDLCCPILCGHLWRGVLSVERCARADARRVLITHLLWTAGG